MESTDDRQHGGVWLDLTGERLWRGSAVLRLRLKSFAVLRYLVAHPGQVVSKEELFQGV
jgi:DNA-binding response OmpR family regulator